MAGDSSPSDQAAQRRHADKMAFERQIQDATGMTRVQVRRSLQAGVRIINDRIAPRPNFQQQPAPSLRPNTINHPVQQLDPRQIDPDLGRARDDGGSPANTLGGVTFLLEDNGAFAYITTPLTAYVAI